MSLLKHWREQKAIALDAAGDQRALVQFSEPEDYGVGHGRPSKENELRSIEDRCAEALELLGELTHFFNLRLEALEATGMSQDKAIEAAKFETQATELYRRWLALG